MDSNKIKSEQIQKFWDSFGEIFSKSLESNTLQMSYSLISQLNLKESESIFEAGIGGGQTIPIIIAIKKKESIYYGVDLSHNLLQLSAYRISYLQNNSNLNGLKFWTNEPFRSQEK